MTGLGYESKCVVCGQRLTPKTCKTVRDIMAAAGWHEENIRAVGDRCLQHLEEFLDRCDRSRTYERAAYERCRMEPTTSIIGGCEHGTRRTSAPGGLHEVAAGRATDAETPAEQPAA